jgi:transposase InsO family protein
VGSLWVWIIAPRQRDLPVLFVASWVRRSNLMSSTSPWVVEQLREAFPYGSAPRFVIFDRDAKYGAEVPGAIRSMKIKCVRTSLRSPWQNGIAERWVESCRRDLLDHRIALSEHHLRRLLTDYVGYYHDDRTHLGLEKRTPNGRARCMASGSILSHDRLGRLHHRYDRAP